MYSYLIFNLDSLYMWKLVILKSKYKCTIVPLMISFISFSFLVDIWLSSHCSYSSLFYKLLSDDFRSLDLGTSGKLRNVVFRSFGHLISVMVWYSTLVIWTFDKRSGVVLWSFGHLISVVVWYFSHLDIWLASQCGTLVIWIFD